MAKKIDIYSSYGEKLVSLFVRLLCERKSYSLNELTRMLQCSKPTVLRLLRDIQKAYRVKLEEEKRGKEKLVAIKTPTMNQPMAQLTHDEWYILNMCRTFTEHLIGKKLFEEATQALVKSRSLMEGSGNLTSGHFECFRPGTIDYTPYHEIIRSLIEAMESKKICKVTYKAIMENRAKTYYICPLKLFSHVDTIYLHAKKARTPGTTYRSPKFNPILPVHRFKAVELTERNFEFPQNYDFENSFNKTFGVMKDHAFEVEVEFTGWAARYVAERVWSPDQKLTTILKDKIKLNFIASSDTEVISRLLSLGENAKVVKPAWLKDSLVNKIKEMIKQY